VSRRRRTRRLLEAAAVAAVAAAIAAFGLAQGYFGAYQNGAIDRLFPSARTDPAIVVVGMDEPSIAAFGAPPWDRDIHGQIARNLASAGARVIVWDVVFFASADDTTAKPDQAAQTLALAKALADVDAAGVVTILGVDGKLPGRVSEAGVPLLDPVFDNIPELADAATAGAHVKVDTADGDGVVREVPLVVETADGRFVPSLSLAAVLAYRGASLQPIFNVDGVQAGGRFVPTEGRLRMRLNFSSGLAAKVGSRTLVSARDLYCATEPTDNTDCADTEPLDPSRFRDKVVFVGATAESARDNFDTPINKSGGLPGVFIHANAANTMLTASYLGEASDALTVVVVGVLCFLVALAVLFLPLWLSPLLALALMLLYLYFTAFRFDRGTIMNVVYPIVLMVLTFFAAVMVRYFTETRHRQRVSKLFAQYVPEAVAQQLVDEGRVEQAAEGERLDVSLFFCDLRGFTAMSRSLTPQQVRAMLNEFYDLLTDITLDHNGTVLKFVGDEVFAVFGAPLPVERHPEVALECAMAILRAAPALTATLDDMGIPPAHFGIGMNTGEVVAAHVGGGKRRQYDIVGDTVNIGSRMCGQAGKGDIVMPKAMYDALHDPPRGESMGLVSLKNVEVPIELIRIRVDWDAPDDEPGAPAPGGTATAEAATMGS
jgi:adenylate cyclase